MWRAYQSPYMGTDCGPQCDQMPNLASRYHSGQQNVRRLSRFGAKGPFAMSNGNSLILGSSCFSFQ